MYHRVQAVDTWWCCGGEGGDGDTSELCFSVQFYCEPTTALKSNLLIKETQYFFKKSDISITEWEEDMKRHHTEEEI